MRQVNGDPSRPSAVPVTDARAEATFLRSVAVRAGYDVKTLVAGYPAIAMPAARLRRRHGVVLGSGTELVIEGYPRSANNFAVIAFAHAQGRPIAIAHHTHAPAHLIAAIRAGVPALMLIRQPEDAVLEFVIARPALSFGGALRGYIRFAQRLLPLRDQLGIGLFPVVTSDFGTVIRAVNDKFATNFVEFAHTDTNVRRCFAEMEHYWSSRADLGTIERRIGRPSILREKLKNTLRACYHQPGLSPLRAQANELYAAFSVNHTDISR